MTRINALRPVALTPTTLFDRGDVAPNSSRADQKVAARGAIPHALSMPVLAPKLRAPAGSHSGGPGLKRVGSAGSLPCASSPGLAQTCLDDGHNAADAGDLHGARRSYAAAKRFAMAVDLQAFAAASHAMAAADARVAPAASSSAVEAPAGVAKSDQLADGVAAAGKKAATAIATGASSVASMLRSGATAAVEKGWIGRCETASGVNPTVKEAVHMAHTAASATAGATAAVTGAVTDAVDAIARSVVATAVRSFPVRSKAEARGTVPSRPDPRVAAVFVGPRKVGIAAASATFSVLDAVSGATKEVLAATTDATATIVEHRFGEGYGELVLAVGGTASDLASAASAIGGFSLRALSKKAVSKTAVQAASAMCRTLTPDQTPEETRARAGHEHDTCQPS